MKKFLCATLALVMCLGLFAGCAPAADNNGGNTGADLSGTYDITMWVSEKEGVADQFKSQIDAFEAANPGITINAKIEGVTEADAASKVIADVATAPDLYCFAQDQLARLVQAAALAKPGKATQDVIIANNDAGSVAGVKVAGEIYAYPMTSDNGYYMYYDKSIITEEDAKDLSKLVRRAARSSALLWRTHGTPPLSSLLPAATTTGPLMPTATSLPWTTPSTPTRA